MRIVAAAYLGGIVSAVQGAVTTIGAAGAAGGAEVGDLISAGGSFSAAGALIYIVKKITDGQMVSRDAARVEAQQADQIRELTELVAAGHIREGKLEALYTAALGRSKASS